MIQNMGFLRLEPLNCHFLNTFPSKDNFTRRHSKNAFELYHPFMFCFKFLNHFTVSNFYYLFHYNCLFVFSSAFIISRLYLISHFLPNFVPLWIKYLFIPLALTPGISLSTSKRSFCAFFNWIIESNCQHPSILSYNTKAADVKQPN